jgi:hypothetical protein
MQTRLSSTRFGRTAPRTPTGSLPSIRRTTSRQDTGLWRRLSWPLSLALFAIPLALALATLLVPPVCCQPGGLGPRYRSVYWHSDIGRDNQLWRRCHDHRGGGFSDRGAGRRDGPCYDRGAWFRSASRPTLARNGPARLASCSPSDRCFRGNCQTLKRRLASPERVLHSSRLTATERVVTTDGDGRYTFEEVPEGAIVRFSSC